LFSLTNSQYKPIIINVRNGYEGRAIYCHSSYGPVFGIDDLVISNNFKTSSSSSNLANSYVNSEIKFLAGNVSNFLVEELEVFEEIY